VTSRAQTRTIMSPHLDVVTLRGSERQPVFGAHVVGPADPAERIEVSVLLRSRFSSGRTAQVEALGQRPLDRRTHMTREEFEAIHGSGPGDIAQVERFAQRHHLDVISADPARRTVVLAGTIADMSRAFGVELARWSAPHGEYRGRTGSIKVPAELGPVVQGVFGLDDRAQAAPHLRRAAHDAADGGLTTLDVGRAYGFPHGLDGNGETIALIELGGGFRSSDLSEYFQSLGLPMPRVAAVSVDGAHNRATGDPEGPDGEVMLDIEVAGALAPGANIVVYFAPNTARGFLDAVTTAIHDRSHRPSILSISWGAPESHWTQQAMRGIDEAFQAAAMLGVTVLAASGDNGASDGVDDGLAHVDFPASSPHVLACGGTRLELHANGAIVETAWGSNGNGATGGGVSNVFRLPSWQDAAGVPPSVNPGRRVGRGVPDVAGDADPATGYRVRIDGRETTYGGTSAVAPLWAALVARLNQRLGRHAGYLNPLLYRSNGDPHLFADVVSGSNGAYAAGADWDACTGLGSPRAGALIEALASPSPAREDDFDPLAFGLSFNAEEGGGHHPHPTKHPTPHPTKHPTPHPTKHPTPHPTAHPSPHPTPHPTGHPTGHPTPQPTGVPTGWPPTGMPIPSGWPTGWPIPTSGPPEPWPTGYPPPTGWPTGVPLPSTWPTGWPLPSPQPPGGLPGGPPHPCGAAPCPPGPWPCCGSPGGAGLAAVAAGLSASAAVAAGIAAGGSGAGR
jgi:kumamolisin